MGSSHDPLAALTVSRRKRLLFAVPLLHANLAIIAAAVARLSAGRSEWPAPELAPCLGSLSAAISVVERSADGGSSAAEAGEVRETLKGAKGAAVLDQDFITAAYLRDAEDILSVPDSPAPTHANALRVARMLRRGALGGYHEDAQGTPAWQEAEVYRATCRTCFADVFGPYPHPHFSGEWRTGTAVAIAAEMYETRDFSAMPILADALQDAGCDRDDILNHCRDAIGTHVRGCWVTDLVLGKE